MRDILKALLLGSGGALAFVVWVAGALGPAMYWFGGLVDAHASVGHFFFWFATFFVWVSGYSAVTVVVLEKCGIDLPSAAPRVPLPPLPDC